jgi:hypothetical protein
MTSFDWVILIVAGYAIYRFDKLLKRLVARIGLLERRVEGLTFRLEAREYLVPRRYRYSVHEELYRAEAEHLRMLDAWWTSWSKATGYDDSDELTAFAWDTLTEWTRAQHPPYTDTDAGTLCVTIDDVEGALRPLVNQTTPAMAAARGPEEREIIAQAHEVVQSHLTKLRNGGAFPATRQRAVEMMRELQLDLLGSYGRIRIHGATLMTRIEILVKLTLFHVLQQRTAKAKGAAPAV